MLRSRAHSRRVAVLLDQLRQLKYTITHPKPIIQSIIHYRPDPMRLVRWAEPQTDKMMARISGEHKIMEVKKHWAASIGAMIRLILGSCLLFWITFTDLTAGPIDFYWFFLSISLAMMLEAFHHLVSEFRDRFVITNQRVFRVSGVMGTARGSIPLVKLLDLTTIKPPLGRWLNYGHLIIESAAQVQGLNQITHVRNVDQREMTIRLAMQGAEEHELFTLPEDADDGT